MVTGKENSLNTTIYIIRHCEAEGNINNVFQGHTDGDISSRGELQLEKLKEACKKLSFDAVYSSPLKRAYKTAQAANFYFKLPVIIENQLIEINGGDMEGTNWDQLQKKFPKEYPLWLNNQSEFIAPNGESMREIYTRITTVIMDIVKKNKGKTICFVSHGCAIRNFLCFAKGLPIEKIDSCSWCDNTGISKVCFDENFIPSVIYENDCRHINESRDTAAFQMFWRDELAK